MSSFEISHPDKPTNFASFPFKMHTNISVDLNLKIFLGLNAKSVQFQVYEIKVPLPKFLNYMHLPDLKIQNDEGSNTGLQFFMKERIPRVSFIKINCLFKK